MAAPLVWINGLPGVGKLTIAKEIGAQEQRAIVISNHSLIDPVHDILGSDAREHPEYQKLRKVERERAFGKWVLDPVHEDKIIVFTDCQSVDELGSSVAREYEAVAKQAGRPFLPYLLSCETEENMKRATSKERMESGTTKLTDEKLLRFILSEEVPFAFDESRLIVVTGEKPEDVARSIVQDCQHWLRST